MLCRPLAFCIGKIYVETSKRRVLLRSSHAQLGRFQDTRTQSAQRLYRLQKHWQPPRNLCGYSTLVNNLGKSLRGMPSRKHTAREIGRRRSGVVLLPASDGACEFDAEPQHSFSLRIPRHVRGASPSSVPKLEERSLRKMHSEYDKIRSQ